MIGTIILYLIGAIALCFLGAGIYFILPDEFFQRHPLMNLLGIPLFILAFFLWIGGTAIPIALFEVYVSPPSFILAIFAIIWMIMTILGATWILSKISQL